MMKISIAMCTYNGERYLQDQLNSILSQARIPDELVVVDDCSTDHTIDILNQFANKLLSFPILIYKNKNNLGSTKNFERAINLCNGDIIVLSDQDDMWMPDKLTKIEKVFKENQNVGYVFSNAEIVDKEMGPLGYTLWDAVDFTPKQFRQYQKGIQVKILFTHNVVTGATMAFRTYFRNLTIPIPELWNHDYWIAFILSCVSKGFPISEQLIKYRQHTNQQIGAKLNTKNKIHDSIRRYKTSNNRVNEFKKAIDYWTEPLARLTNGIKTSYSGKKEFRRAVFLLNNKILHFKIRTEIHNSKKYSNIILIFLELINGRYFLFSNGFKSAVADLSILFNTEE